MKTSWKIGRIAGISVRIHLTFPLLFAWVAIISYRLHGSWSAVAAEMVFIALLFVIIVLHELGHAQTARHFGIRTHDITLLPIGGVARLDRIPRDPKQEFLVAIAGPAVNVVIAGLLFTLLFLLSGTQALFDVQLIQGSLLARLAWVNVTLALFNLAPAFPMDGGRVLRALLAMRLDYVRATNIAAAIGQGLAVVAGMIGLAGNPFLVVIAVFIWIGAAEEAAATRLRSTLSGILVERVMMTEFHTLAPDEPLACAVEYAIAGGQLDFPVLDNGRLVGVLRHVDLLRGLDQAGATSKVGDAMLRNVRTVRETDEIERVLDQLLDDEGRTLPVVRGSELVGLLTAKNLGEYMAIEATLDRSLSRQAPGRDRRHVLKFENHEHHEPV